MAAARAEYAGRGYYTDAFNGSAAYDLDRVMGAVPLPEEEPEQQPSPEELQRQRIQERLRQREQARAKEQSRLQVFGVPVVGIMGVIAAAVLMIAVLMSYIELAGISGQIRDVRSSIETLEDRGEALSVKYEAAFNMAEVETYAVNILGMTRGYDSSTGYTAVYRSDRAEILAEDETAGLVARIKGFLKELPEYFR